MRSVRELARFAARAAQVTYPTGTTSSLSSIAPAASLLQRRVGVAMSAPASVDVDAYKVGDSTNIKWHEGSVDSATREKAMNQKGCVLWFTGLSGSGKVRQSPIDIAFPRFSRQRPPLARTDTVYTNPNNSVS
jgi:adenylylsulfate kinase